MSTPVKIKGQDAPIVGHLMSDNGEYAQVAYHKDNEMRFAMGRIMDWNPVKEVKEGKK